MQPERGEKTNCEEKGRAEREVASCLAWKERGCTPTRMRGPFDLQLPPPPPKMISRRLKLIGFLESAVEESCRGAVTPADLQASAAWPASPGCAARASAMQSILVRRQTADVASCWLHLTRRPLTSPPRGAGDAEKHVMLSGKSKMHWHWRTQTETSAHGAW